MKKIKEGCLFAFEIDENQFALGQVINKEGRSITVVVFDLVSNSISNFEVDSLSQKSIILTLTTMQNFFKLKRWILLEELNVNYNQFHKTIFKVETSEGLFSINQKGEILGKLSESEARNLTYLKNVSPSVVVNTTKAFFKKIPMEDYYSNFLLKK